MEQSQNERIDVLVKWKTQIEHELVEARKQYNELGEALAKKENQLANVEALLEAEGWMDSKDRPQILGRYSSVADNAYAILKEHGKPVYYKDLVLQMKECGVTIPGTDPAANLLTHMSRDERFDRTARGTYALREWGIAKSIKKTGSQKKRSTGKKTTKKANA